MQDDARELIEAAGGPAPGSLRAALANAMVGLKKRYYGRGPEAAKAYVEDDYTVTSAVKELTGRRVVGYHSQVVFDPMRAFEIFVLAPES